MEMRFSLHEPIPISQMDFLNTVDRSRIRTFVRSIGVILEGREYCRPRPFADGIRAEISIAERMMTGEPSYDYWAANNSGDFYTLQSFFEDQRAKGKLFFNTRIIRITEGIMFASNFFNELSIQKRAA